MLRTLRTFRAARMLPLLTALAVGLVPAAICAATPAAAAEASATAFLQAKYTKVRTLLSAPPSADRDKKVDAELAQLVDYEEMGRVALGEEHGKRSKEELQEFTSLLQQLVEKNYKKRLVDTLNYEVVYKDEEPKGSDVVVRTEAKNLKDKREASVEIDYVVRKKGQGFIVVDLVPEGSSMAKTYNKEFAKVIKKDGWAALIKKMKDKLAKT